MHHRDEFRRNRTIRDWVSSHPDITILNIQRCHASRPRNLRSSVYTGHVITSVQLMASYTAADFLVIAVKSCQNMLISNLGAVRHPVVALTWIYLFRGLQKPTLHKNNKFQQNLSMPWWVIDNKSRPLFGSKSYPSEIGGQNSTTFFEEHSPIVGAPTNVHDFRYIA